MAPRSKKLLKAVKEGKVEIIDGYYLDYALLDDGSIAISEKGFFRYLQLSLQSKKFTSFTSLSNTTILYKSLSGKDEMGFTVMELMAFCLGIIQLDSIDKNITRKVILLIMFLATTGLNQLIEEDFNLQKEVTFDDNLAGLINLNSDKK